MAIIRFCGALIGWFFGLYLGLALLQLTVVAPVTDKVLVVFLLASACAILGWLGAPYVTVRPTRYAAARIRAASMGDLLGGTIGLATGLLLALLVSFPLSVLPDPLGRFAPVVATVILGMAGAGAGLIKRTQLAAIARELTGGRRTRAGEPRLLLDTSVIIDGRVSDVVKSGFIHGTLLVPRFILGELQHFADSSDATRRERGRRGLEMLARLQKEATVRVELVDSDPAAAADADGKLVVVARELGVPIMTNDYGLNRVAELQGVTVLNMNDLAKAVRPVVLPGEELVVRVIQEGKEIGQGVGYLEDGTMVVVEGGSRFVGGEMRVAVMRVLQTVAGRMIFAQPRGETPEVRRARAAGQ
ncbi:MAG: PIN domain nuclease [Chloroflexota bacterium]|nr:PIN domain nuclease [Chloroflexota bacterium]